jgi:hypothetical protein
MTRRRKTYDEHIERASRNPPQLRVEALALTKPTHGRRRKNLTTEEIDAFCRALNTPTTFEVACGIVGIPVRTMTDWLSKGQDPEQDDEMLVELAAKYAQTMAGGNRKALVGLIVEHAVDDPKSAMWLADRLIPGANLTKNVKVDGALSLTAVADTTPWHLATDHEVTVIQEYERIKARLRGLA